MNARGRDGEHGTLPPGRQADSAGSIAEQRIDHLADVFLVMGSGMLVLTASRGILAGDPSVVPSTTQESSWV